MIPRRALWWRILLILACYALARDFEPSDWCAGLTTEEIRTGKLTEYCK